MGAILVTSNNQMKYRQLGSSDLHVSEISLGSWLTYGVGVDDSNARACLNRAFEVGINFIDTANVYGRGAAETFLGSALKGRDRSQTVCVAVERGADVSSVASNSGEPFRVTLGWPSSNSYSLCAPAAAVSA